MDNARGMNMDVAQPQLACHDSRLLDLAFALDTTSSMSPYIHSACTNIRHIVEDIVAKESNDLRLALVEYRDHPPEESTYVTQVHDFTPSVGTMKNWLEASKAVGGGDTPEAVADALHDVLKLSWRPEATKICVLISDAPPHGLNPQGGDRFPEGCPAGHDPVDLARKLAEKGVTLYMVGCEPALTPYKEFFAALAYITGGQYVPLSAAGALTAVIVGGAQEEMSLEQWMEQVNQLVMQEVQQQGEENVSHDFLSHQVMDRLSHAGARSKKLHMNKTALQSASAEAVALSNCADMAAMRSKFKASEPPTPAPAPWCKMKTSSKAVKKKKLKGKKPRQKLQQRHQWQACHFCLMLRWEERQCLERHLRLTLQWEECQCLELLQRRQCLKPLPWTAMRQGKGRSRCSRLSVWCRNLS